MSFRRDVVAVFRKDIDAWRRNGWSGDRPIQVMAMLMRHNGLRATLLHRVAFWASQHRIYFIPSIITQINLMLHGIELPPSVPIGQGLYMPHTTGTVITARRIGANVTIQGGITIGQRGSDGYPEIADGAFLGAGCRIIGGIHIGEYAQIGANAVVLTDVPAGHTAVGVPATLRAPRAVNGAADAIERELDAPVSGRS